MSDAVFESIIPGLPDPKRGKVRDVYDLGDKILLVATDRISAFDVVFPTAIPDKGKVLNSLTLFWLDLLGDVIPNHLITADLGSLNLPPETEKILSGRSLVVKKAKVVPFECIVRGYIVGSGWKEYAGTGTICGLSLPQGLRLADKLPEPVFTPSTKADVGHDENVAFQAMSDALGAELSSTIKNAAISLYNRAASHALEKGIIIADTKFEFGLLDDGELILIDEVLTPDSSRFWPKSSWTPGENPPSFDKQYLRDWLENDCKWSKQPPAPSLPAHIVTATRARYLDAHRILTGKELL